MKGKVIQNVTNTSPEKKFSVETKGAQNVTMYVKNTGANAFNHFSIRSRPNGALTPCIRFTAAGWTGAAFDMTGAAGNPSALASSGENEIRFPTNGCDLFEVWIGVASGTGIVNAMWHTDADRE